MNRVSQKMEVVKKQVRRLQENLQNTTEPNQGAQRPTSFFAKQKIHPITNENIFLILGGTVAGIAIAVILWWAEPARKTDTGSRITLKSYQSIQASDIKKVNAMEPPAAGAVNTTTETEGLFTPTHTVMARLNLRPSASLSTTPITVMEAGSKVEYIRETAGWYYVHTRSHGKGWCSSDYLSPLLPDLQRASAE